MMRKKSRQNLVNLEFLYKLATEQNLTAPKTKAVLYIYVFLYPISEAHDA